MVLRRQIAGFTLELFYALSIGLSLQMLSLSVHAESTQGSAQLIVSLGHSDRLTSIAVSDDEKYLLTGSSDTTAIL